MLDKILYSYKQPYDIQYLQVDSIHRLQICKFGNPKGIPLIFYTVVQVLVLINIVLVFLIRDILILLFLIKEDAEHPYH